MNKNRAKLQEINKREWSLRHPFKSRAIDLIFYNYKSNGGRQEVRTKSQKTRRGRLRRRGGRV